MHNKKCLSWFSRALMACLIASGSVHADDRFQGKVGRTDAESIPHWPEEAKPPANAPNILIWLMDDVGFGHWSSYGGLVETDHLDKLAKTGLQFTNFHATPLCSPSRASLLTGRNPHNVGMGAHANTAAGYPGYNARVPKSAATIARILQDSGYATFALGKWDHMPAEHMSAAGPFDYWPSGQGFQHFYGFLHFDANHYQPTLWSDHTPVTDAEVGDPVYHLTEDLADHAIAAIDQQRALDPNQPFFMYWSTGAVHAPHHAPKAYIEKYRGKFDGGWNAAREHILARQKSLGLIPADAQLPDWPEGVPRWSDLTREQQKMAARQMEVFAAMLDHADDQFGRILAKLEKDGELDNTIILVTSDNGASAEGGLAGTFNELTMGQVGWEDNLKHFDGWGGPDSFPHYAVGWAAAGNTPFKYYKQSAFEGGNRVPMLISWNKGLNSRGEKRSQFHHISDIVPTLLDLTGVKAPHTVAGIKQKPMDGTSFRYALENPAEPSHKKVQYFELWGNRGIWADGWKANIQLRPKPWDVYSRPTVDSVPWELYNTNEDFNERINLAATHPKKLEEMKALFAREAERNHVYPLLPDFWGAMQKRMMERLAARKGEFSYGPASVRIPAALTPPISAMPFDMIASLNNTTGVQDGVIFSYGGHGGGMALYLDQGKPVFAYNRLGFGTTELRTETPLPSRQTTLALIMDRKPDSKTGAITLLVDGKAVARGEFENLSTAFPLEETFEVGADYGSPVVQGYPARQQLPQDFIREVKFRFAVPPQKVDGL